MALRVFPPTVTQPRKSSLKKPKPSDAMAGEVKGVAFHVSPTTASPVVVQAADRHIKHALFCEPSSSTRALGSGSFRKQLRESRHSSVAASDVTSIRCDSPVDGNDDRLSPLPENSNFGSPSSRTQLSPGIERPAFPLNVSTEAQPSSTTPVSPSGDTLTALPGTARFTPATSPPRAEYQATIRSRPSTSPTLAYGWSPASSVPPYSPHDPARQPSIFPRWDPSKPLCQQQYYPHARSSTPTHTVSEKGVKGTSPSAKRQTLPPLDLELVNPTATVVVGYEHIPVANSSDLLEVWNASCDKHPGTGRKALFRLIQPRNEGTALAVGVADDALLWSMKKNKPAVAVPDVEPPELLMISKHPPGNPDLQTVAQLALPEAAPPDQSAAEDDYVSIFPHMAAINAIEAVANSPAAAAIAQADPTAKSPEAAKLAQDAVSAAHQRCRSVLVRTTRERDGLGAVTATYRLEHPTLGSFPITVTKSKEARHARDPRANISLHHPSATPAAVAAETLVLAFLDFARDACVLDVPGLLALEGSYIIDTVMCALLAVAVIENDALKGKRMTFEAPPKSPLPVAKRESRNVSNETNTVKESRRSNGLLRRNKKKKKKEEIELPVLTQGALALLGFSFKVAVWTLELGVKATAGVIVGTTHVMSKA